MEAADPMNRLQLATLVKWSGTLHTRKRLQKVVYLLQSAGCNLDADFTLHHYGPYSPDVAGLTDDMVRAGLLTEEQAPNAKGFSYSYQLADTALRNLEHYQERHALDPQLSAICGFEETARRLLDEDSLQKLELAATIAFFRRSKPGTDWDHARQAAAKFKRKDPADECMSQAEQFAREIMKS
jgi:uncharacterized protein YwgA